MNLRDQLLAIRDEYGRLTPTLVVEVAKAKNHPLHGRFEWNNAVAGDAWRRHQASELIRSVKIVYLETDEEQSSVRAFHAVRDEQGEHVYEPAETVADSPFLSQLVLRDMERDWQALKRRYGHFAEFVALVRSDVA